MNNLTVIYPKDKLKAIKSSVINKKLTKKAYSFHDLTNIWEYLTKKERVLSS